MSDLRDGAVYAGAFHIMDDQIAQLRRSVQKLVDSGLNDEPHRDSILHPMFSMFYEDVINYAAGALRDGFPDLTARVLEKGREMVAIREEADQHLIEDQAKQRDELKKRLEDLLAIVERARENDGELTPADQKKLAEEDQ